MGAPAWSGGEPDAAEARCGFLFARGVSEDSLERGWERTAENIGGAVAGEDEVAFDAGAGVDAGEVEGECLRSALGVDVDGGVGVEVLGERHPALAEGLGSKDAGGGGDDDGGGDGGGAEPDKNFCVE
jgi:hypothetical protein